MKNWLRNRIRSQRGKRNNRSCQQHAEYLEKRTLLAAFSWNTDADGNWNDPANWAGPGGVPGDGDDVLIDRPGASPRITVDSSVRAETLVSTEEILIDGGNLQVDADAQVAAVTLASGEFDVDGTTTLTGQLAWQGGDLFTNNLQISATGILRVTGTANRYWGSVRNAGQVVQDIPFATPFRGTGFHNLSTGVWTVASDFNSPGGFSITFVNEGQFRKTGAGAGRFNSVNDQFRHIAGSSVHVEGGTLFLARTGSQTEPSTGADFSVAEDAVLNLVASGDSYLVGTYTGTGAGRIEHTQGRVVVSDYLGGTGATFNFADGLYHWTGGVLWTDSSGGDAFVNAGHMQWSGDGDRQLWGQSFYNAGTVHQSDAGLSRFNSSGQGTYFHNQGLFEHSGTGNVTGGRILNSGTIRSNAGDKDFDTQIHNAAGSALEVTAGRARLTDGGEFQTSRLTATGTGVIELNKQGSKDFQLLDGATLNGTGDGRIEFSAGRIESVNANAVMHFANGLFHWTGGEFFRDVSLSGQMTISGAASKRISNGFTNFGSVIHTAGTFVNSSSAGITNTASGTWEMQGDASFGGQAFVTARFLNAGTLRKTGPDRAEILDGGVALVNMGGTVEVLQGELRANHSGNAAGSGGHFHLNAGTTLEIIGTFDSTGVYSGSGAGSLLINASARDGLTLNFPEGMATLSIPDTADVHNVTNAGFLRIDGKGQQQQFGHFTNTGTVFQAPGTEIQMRNYSRVENEGTWELSGDAFISFYAFDRLGAQFTNRGTLRKTGPLGTSSISQGGNSLPIFSNSGIVEVQSGTLDIHELNLLQFDDSAGVLAGGNWVVHEFATLRIVDADGNTPDITLNQADVTLIGPSSDFPNMDALAENYGRFRITDGRDLTLAGTLMNAGGMSQLSLQEESTLPGGRQIGIATDYERDRVITQVRNDLVDGLPVFRIRNRSGAEIGTSVVQPGPAVEYSGIDVTSVPLNIGGTEVPAGSLVFLNAEASPVTLYGIDLDSGEVLASVELPEVAIDQPGMAVHPGRGTVFSIARSNGTITEINPVDGSRLNSFPVWPSGTPFFFMGWGGMDVTPAGNLLVSGSSQERLREMTPAGEFVGDIDLSLLVIGENFSDLSIDSFTGEVTVPGQDGKVHHFGPLESVAGELVVGPESTLTVDALNAPGSLLTAEINGRPDSEAFGRFVVNGNVDLTDATVQIAKNQGFAPTKDDVYEVVSFQQRTGTPSEFKGLDPFFSANVSATNVTVTALSSGTDLEAADVLVPVTAVPGESFDVSWTVRNLSTTELPGGWFDSAYLSRDLTISADDIVLGRSERTTPLAGLSEYQANLSTTFPGVVDGPWFVLVVADSRNEVADVNRANNFAASATPVESNIQELDFAIPSAGTIARGEDLYFRVDIDQPGNVFLNLEQNAPLQAEFYVSHRRIPTRADFDFHAPDLRELQQQIQLVSPVQGPWYIWMYGLPGSGSGQNFTLSAEHVVFAVDDISPTRGDNSGTALITINGSGFSPDATVELLDSGDNVVASGALSYFSSDTVAARFDLTGLAAGQYMVRVTDALGTDTAQTPFEVSMNNPGRLSFSLTGTGRIRPGGSATAFLEFRNIGGGDIDSPLVMLETTGGTIRHLESKIAGTEVLAVLPLGGADGSSRSVISPGESGRIPLRVTAEAADVSVTIHQLREEPISITIYPRPTRNCSCIVQPIVIPAPDPFAPDWNALKDTLKPSYVADDAWEAIYDNFLKEVGSDVGAFEDMLRRNADYLSSLGYENLTVDDLISFELQRAGNWGDLVRRNHISTFGRGQVGPDDKALTVDEDGNVTVRYGWIARFFELESDGSYMPLVSRDQGRLIPLDDGWQITELNGSREFFDADGRGIRVEDAGGQGTDFTYADGRLSSVVLDNGDSADYSYNAAGLVSRVEYPGGKAVDYTYDSTGQYLLSIRTSQGEAIFDYVTEGPRPTLHAVRSITLADGTQLNFSYDDRGRILREWTTGNEVNVRYRYDQPGGVTTIFADGTEQTELFGMLGEISRYSDPLGAVTTFSYDADRFLTGITDAAHNSSQFVRDPLGRKIESIGPDGRSTQFSYDQFSGLGQLKDARGRNTTFLRNENGYVQLATYQDGTQERVEYDERGNRTIFTGRDGHQTFASYNSLDQLTRVEYSVDGSATTYVYNDRRYLISATNEFGTLEFTYDEHNNLLRVDYPGGRFTEYTYDGTGRLLRTSDSSGSGFTNVYDDIGRIASIVDDGGQAIVGYTYNEVGQVTRITNANGTYTLVTYDEVGRTESRNTYDVDDAVVWLYEYSYDLAGKMTSMTTNQGTWTYGYDSYGQLTSTTSPNGQVTTYTYDEVGNRVAVQVDTVSTVYSTDEMNRYQTAGQFFYEYDAVGNTIRKSDGVDTWEYEWTANGQLAAVSGPNGVFSYDYDALYQLIAVTRDGVRTELLPDFLRNSPLAQFDSSGNKISGFVTGIGLAAEVTSGGATDFFSFDIVGNTVGITDSSGAVLNEYQYLPFGQVAQKTETRQNMFQFGGGLGVASYGDGLLHMGYRRYDPQIGRFTSEDPIGFQGRDVNLYRYVQNRPNMFTDSSGLTGETEWGDGLTREQWLARMKELGVEFPDDGGADPPSSPGPPDGPDGPDGPGSPKPTSPSPDMPPPRQPGILPGANVDAIETGLQADLDDAKKLTNYIPPGARKVGRKLLNFVPVLPLVLSATEAAQAETSADQADAVIGGIAGEVPFADFALIPWSILTAFKPEINTWTGEAAYNSIYGEWSLQTAWDFWTGNSWTTFTSFDPNDIIGPAGVGDGNYITGEQVLPYTIRFENLDTAEAPAAEVFITQQLDSDLDWSTFELNDIGFGETVIDVPDGLTSWQTRLDLSDSLGIWLDIDAGVNLETGLASWTFRSLDPATGDLPDDPLLGFLPPNMTSPEGEGFVSYQIEANADVLSGARLDAEARIIFDTNEPIDTPLHFNTIDYLSPDSFINALPADTVGEFEVTLTTDDQGGSGASSFDIYVSTDGGPFQKWAEDAGQTTLTFEGQPGHTYSLYSVARDLVGNEELPPESADAMTTLMFPDVITIDPIPVLSQDRNPTFTWNAVADADRYEVWLARLAPNQSRIFVDSSNVHETQFTPPESLQAGIYRLWVRHFTGSGQAGSWSDSATFEIQPALNGPLTPVFESRPTFTWEEIPFADGYQIFVRGKSEDVVETTTETSWTPDQDLPDGPLRWWIRPTNTIGNRGWSPAGHTRIDGRSMVLGPVDPVSSSDVTLFWQAVAGAGRYILYIHNLDTGLLALRQDHVTETSFTTDQLAGGNYRVWVKAISADNDSFQSGKWSRGFDIEVVRASTSDFGAPVIVALPGLQAPILESHSDQSPSGSPADAQPVLPPETYDGKSDDEAAAEFVKAHIHGLSKASANGIRPVATEADLIDWVFIQEFVEADQQRQSIDAG